MPFKLKIYLFILIQAGLWHLESMAQSLPSIEYFKPYKYPNRYSYDGCYSIGEFGVILPKNNDGWGGYIRFDIGSKAIKKESVRVNYGMGINHSNNKFKKEFPSSPIIDGTSQPNYVKDMWNMTRVQLHSRILLRSLNPINISICGGLSADYLKRETEATYNVNHHYSFLNDMSANSVTAGWKIGYFYEIKALLNWGSGGISAGYVKSSNTLPIHSPYHVGIWFGLNQKSKVNSEE